MNWDLYEDTLVRLFESAIDREIEALQQERETSMNENETSFKVGDRVQTNTTKRYLGKITELRTVTYASVYDGEEYMGSWAMEDLEYAKLSEEDTWLEVALTCGTKVKQCGVPLLDIEAREIRHRAYQILGGNGIRVTEDVKARVRSLIERAKRV